MALKWLVIFAFTTTHSQLKNKNKMYQFHFRISLVKQLKSILLNLHSNIFLSFQLFSSCTPKYKSCFEENLIYLLSCEVVTLHKTHLFLVRLMSNYLFSLRYLAYIFLKMSKLSMSL